MRFDKSKVIYEKNDRVYVDVNMDGISLISPWVLVGYIPPKAKYRSAKVLLDTGKEVTCILDNGEFVIIPKQWCKPVIKQNGVLRIEVEKKVEVVKEVKSKGIKDLNLAVIISQSILILVMLLAILIF